MINNTQDVNQYLARVQSFLLDFYKENNKEKREQAVVNVALIRDEVYQLFSNECGFDDIQSIVLTNLFLKYSYSLSDVTGISGYSIAERFLQMLKGELRAGLFVGIVVKDEEVEKAMKCNIGNDKRNRIIAILSLIFKKVGEYCE